MTSAQIGIGRAPRERIATHPPQPVGRRLRAAPRAGMLVDRRRLLQPLADATSLALLVAPAGYGKTTLLRQWAERDGRPFTWMTAGEPNDGSALRDALSRWAEAGRGAVLVVDDAHLLKARASRDALAGAVRESGPEHVLAIASRSDPGLPVGRLRTQDRLVELGPYALAMTEREAAMLLRRAGAPQDPADVAVLHARTEGWPAALHLAALALRDHDATLESFAGDDRFVADYLRDEVLPALTPKQLAFMRRTSILDRLSGPLCDAVVGRDDSAQVLRELARVNVMVTPIDRAEEQFRCHRLLADMLRADLRRIAPAELPSAHRRASLWHERQGDIDRAIDHAIAAGDKDRSDRLLWSVAARYAFGGRVASLEAWLARFSPDEIAVRPELALATAAGRLMLGDGDGAERWMGAAESTIDSARAESRGPMTAGLMAVRAGIARDGIARMAQDAGRAYDLDTADGPWRTLACLLGGTAAQVGGGPDSGRALLEEGARRAGIGAMAVKTLCLAQLAASALERGDRDEGVELAARARAGVVEAGLQTSGACALVFAVSASALAHDGAVDAAQMDAAAATRLLDQGPSIPGWYEAETRLFIARAHLRLSNAEQARELLTQAGRALRALPDATRLQAWLEDAWERSDSFAETSVMGPEMLTTAELRVLRFLPSHLSFREIAVHLHVSANTIKTQAHAVYRKLDASSRSQAVQRARSVGLVDG
jgi:LuxR family maltose regulon positive regulatory protein